jgi:hypothetical protein
VDLSLRRDNFACSQNNIQEILLLKSTGLLATDDLIRRFACLYFGLKSVRYPRIQKGRTLGHLWHLVNILQLKSTSWEFYFKLLMVTLGEDFRIQFSNFDIGHMTSLI